MNFKQRYIEDDIEVEFVQYYKDTSRKMTSNLSYPIIKIMVYKNKNIIATYKRSFDKKINSSYYSNFIKKFLKNPDYRVEYLEDDFINWEGTIDVENQHIKQQCSRQIERINTTANRNLKFKDFLDLKTYGIDKYSKMKKKDLLKVIPEEDFLLLHKEFDDEKLVISAMRWIARGLKVEYAVRKVKTDISVENNKKTIKE